MLRKTILAIFLVLCGLIATSSAQQPINIKFVSVLPAACSPKSAQNSVVYKYTATSGLYYCSATNTWTAISGGGGGSGTVTATGGSLTSNGLVLGAGTVDTKVSTGLNSDGTAKLILGIAGSTVGSLDFKNATSGTINLAPAVGALGSSSLILPIASDTLVGKATTDTLTNKTITDPTNNVTADHIRVKSNSVLAPSPTEGDIITLADGTLYHSPANSSWTQILTASSFAGVNAQTGTTYTFLQSDFSKLVTISNSSAIAATLPQAGAGGAFASGWMCWLQNRGTGIITVTPTTSTIDGAATLTLYTQEGVAIFSDGTNYYTYRGKKSTLTNPTITTQALTDAATIATNADLGNIATVTLGGNRTLGAPTNLKVGGTYAWQFTQDGTGSRTLAYNAVFLFPGGTAPTLSTGAGKVDVMTCISFDGVHLSCNLLNDVR